MLRARLTQAWQQLRDLTPIPADPGSVVRISWNRHNTHYRPLLRLAKTILAAGMPDLTAGNLSVTGFTLRLYDVFEQFVRAALRTAFHATMEQFPDQPEAHGLHLDTYERVRLNPDLGLRIDGDWRFIGDVKYKRDSATGSGLSPDLYQLLAYATAADLSDATLIYADGPATAPSHHIRHTSKVLHVHHLDLNQPPRDVLRSISQLASETSADPRYG